MCVCRKRGVSPCACTYVLRVVRVSCQSLLSCTRSVGRPGTSAGTARPTGGPSAEEQLLLCSSRQPAIVKPPTTSGNCWQRQCDRPVERAKKQRPTSPSKPRAAYSQRRHAPWSAAQPLPQNCATECGVVCPPPPLKQAPADIRAAPPRAPAYGPARTQRPARGAPRLQKSAPHTARTCCGGGQPHVQRPAARPVGSRSTQHPQQEYHHRHRPATAGHSASKPRQCQSRHPLAHSPAAAAGRDRRPRPRVRGQEAPSPAQRAPQFSPARQRSRPTQTSTDPASVHPPPPPPFHPRCRPPRPAAPAGRVPGKVIQPEPPVEPPPPREQPPVVGHRRRVNAARREARHPHPRARGHQRRRRHTVVGRGRRAVGGRASVSDGRAGGGAAGSPPQPQLPVAVPPTRPDAAARRRRGGEEGVRKAGRDGRDGRQAGQPPRA